MAKETLTTKRKLEILKEFGEFWKEMAEFYSPERLESAVLLWLYNTLIEEKWVEDWAREELVEMVESTFTLEYVDKLVEKYCTTKQDLILLREWIWFAWGLLNEDEDIYEAIDNTKELMKLIEQKRNKEDLPILFRTIYGEIEKENDEEEKENIINDIKKIRG